MIEIDLLNAGRKGRSRQPGRLATASWSLQSLLADRWVVACAATAVACLAVSVHLLLSARQLRAAWGAPLTLAVQDSVRHAAELATMESLEADLRVAAATVAAVEKIDGRRYEWPRIMSEVAGLLPPEAWIVRLARSTPGPATRFLLDGRAWSDQAVARFQSGLDSSPYLAGVQPVAIERTAQQADRDEPEQLYSFVLEGGYELGFPAADAPPPPGSSPGLP